MGVIDNKLIFACREIVIYIMIYNIFLTQSPENLQFIVREAKKR